MRKLTKLLAACGALWLVATASLALAQSVQQSGSVTPGRAAVWSTTGVIRDGGSPNAPQLNSLGLYNGSSTPFCISSTSTAGTVSGNYAQLCFGVSSTAATISVNPFGALSTIPLNIVINGTTYPIGGSNWLSSIIDSQIGSTQGSIIYRGASTWTALTPGSSGQVLQTQGSSSNPQWASVGGVGSVTSITAGTGLTGGTIVSSGTIALSTPVSVANGGTGATSLTSNAVLLGNGTSAVQVSAPGASGTVLQSNGVGVAPTWNAVAGTGTVTSVDGASGITCSPSPITSSGTCSLSTIADGRVLANVSGSTAAPSATATPRLGIAGTTTGTLGLAGATSGTVTIQPQAAAGTFNFNLPTSAGTSGQPLLSGGGGLTAMTFGTLGVGAGGTGLTSPGTSGNVLTSNGSAWVSSTPAGGITMSTQTFTASGTWTKPAGLLYAIVLTTGGGGGATGGAGVTIQSGGPGGGAGATCLELFAAASLGATETVTIGAGGSGAASGGNGTAGGNSTFGALHTAAGGSASVAASLNGGAGGTCTGGTFNIPGGSGVSGDDFTGGSVGSGSGGKAGGASYWGGSARGGPPGAAASASTVCGAGGSGGGSFTGTGGAGADGCSVVIEFKQ